MKILGNIILFSLLTICFSCHSSGEKNNQSNTTATRQYEDLGLPQPDHIVILVEENHGYDQIIGSKLTPFINKLAKEEANFTNAHGIIHPSQPNYIGLFSGSLQGVYDDGCIPADTPFVTPNLGRALIDADFSFIGYAESMPHAGFTGCTYGKSALNGSPLYGRKHCPWVNWQGAKENGLEGKIVSLPFSEFPNDFNQLPTVSMVIPNLDHDMHNHGGDPKMIRLADD